MNVLPLCVVRHACLVIDSGLSALKRPALALPKAWKKVRGAASSKRPTLAIGLSVLEVDARRQTSALRVVLCWRELR